MKKSKFSEDFKARAIALVKSGKSHSQAGKEMGCHPSNISKWLKEVKSDELVPIYRDPEIVLPQPIFRYHADSVRRYYTKDPFQLYVGVTSALSATMPMDLGLLQWMAGFPSYEAYTEKLNELADYGTMWHILCGDIAWRGLSLDTLEARLKLEAVNLGRSEAWGKKHTRIMQKHLLSYKQFLHDHEVEILAIELPVILKRYGVASCVDQVIRMNFNRKRVLAILDLKSGSSTYDSYKGQLKCYELGFKETYPQFQHEHIMLFNLNPTDWGSKPTYRLTNQTDKFSEERLANYLCNLKHHVKIDPGNIMRFSGYITKESLPEDHYQEISFQELIQEK